MAGGLTLGVAKCSHRYHPVQRPAVGDLIPFGIAELPGRRGEDRIGKLLITHIVFEGHPWFDMLRLLNDA